MGCVPFNGEKHWPPRSRREHPNRLFTQWLRWRKTHLAMLSGSCETPAPCLGIPCHPVSSPRLSMRLANSILCLVWMVSGCAALPARGPAPQGTLSNPLFVASTNEELVWERAIDVLHQYHFEIARENRLSRVIETNPRTASGLLEPWHPDSVGFANRLEGSLQSVRRIARLTLAPREDRRGYYVTVEVFREREDLPGVAANSPGAATFQESIPLERDLDPVVGQTTSSTWIRDGRDPALEQALLQSLYTAYSR